MQWWGGGTTGFYPLGSFRNNSLSRPTRRHSYYPAAASGRRAERSEGRGWRGRKSRLDEGEAGGGRQREREREREGWRLASHVTDGRGESSGGGRGLYPNHTHLTSQLEISWPKSHDLILIISLTSTGSAGHHSFLLSGGWSQSVTSQSAG